MVVEFYDFPEDRNGNFLRVSLLRSDDGKMQYYMDARLFWNVPGLGKSVPTKRGLRLKLERAQKLKQIIDKFTKKANSQVSSDENQEGEGFGEEQEAFTDESENEEKT